MIELNCERCGKLLRISPEFCGKTGKCNGCGGPVYVPEKALTVAQESVLSKSDDPEENMIPPNAATDWRNEPPSDLQMSRLADLGATPSQMRNLTKEQASNLIEELQNRPSPINININNAQNSYPQHPVYPYPPKSRLVYILLGLFLGGFGIHNFYAGRSGIGASQLLIVLFTGWLLIPLVIVGFWIIIEICTVNRDGTGVPFI